MVNLQANHSGWMSICSELVVTKGQIMDFKEIRDYSSVRKGVKETFPFDEKTLVFKVLDKMFALTVPLVRPVNPCGLT